MNAAIRRKLEALQHPQAETVALDTDAGLRLLVKWLENRKIRYYTPEDRRALDDTESPVWPGALQAYLTDLGGEALGVTSSREREIVADWLLSYAIGMEYSDRADKLHTIASPPAVTAPAAQPAAPSVPRLKKVALAPKAPVGIELDTGAPEFRKALEELADTLELPHDDDSEAMVRACAAVLEQKLSADARARAQTPLAATEKRERALGKGRPGGPATFNLKDFPPGFDTGDETLNKAAALLRLLYVSDLRRLQDEVNRLITSMQDYTANPKTDSSLGKVGR